MEADLPVSRVLLLECACPTVTGPAAFLCSVTVNCYAVRPLTSSTLEVVTSEPEVVPNTREVVPNRAEVVPKTSEVVTSF